MIKLLKAHGWRLVFVIGHLLMGYALAAPVRLNFYFNAKPGIDLLTDVLLTTALCVLGFKWFKEKAPGFIFTIPFLALIWLRLDFLLFSMSAWWSIVSYLLFAAWALALVALWSHFKPRFLFAKHLLLTIIIGGIGFLWGLTDDQYLLSIVVACLFFAVLPLAGKNEVDGQGLFNGKLALVLLLTPLLIPLNLDKPIFFQSQKRHHDKIVFSQQTRFQRLDVTVWKGNYWFYQDDINHFSSIDPWLYYEPFVHPAMHLAPAQPRVLIIGGENGMLANALKQYDISSIDMLPIDWEYLEIAESNAFYTSQNEGVFGKLPINVIAHSSFRWLNKAKAAYDVIFVDVPDPIDIELNQYYTQEFYNLAHQALTTDGLIITQSGSPYFATAAFQSIEQTMKSAEYAVASFHNQVLSLGEWGWTLGTKSGIDPNKKLRELTFEGIETQWLNQEAMQMMLSFGKPYVSGTQVQVNTIQNPVIHRLYKQGNYQLN